MNQTRKLHLESCEHVALCAEAYRRFERAEQTEGNINGIEYWKRALDNALEQMIARRNDLDREAQAREAAWVCPIHGQDCAGRGKLLKIESFVL